jgi:hypothetical protein
MGVASGIIDSPFEGYVAAIRTIVSSLAFGTSTKSVSRP